MIIEAREAVSTEAKRTPVVLLVDDDESLRQLVADFLERHGMEVLPAADGPAADAVLARHVQSPVSLEGADSNLVGGAINAGTSGLHQELVFRPTVGLGRPETPIEGLYLASASAHPGGGVHGACGWNAARTAIANQRPAGGLRRAMLRTAWSRVLRD